MGRGDTVRQHHLDAARGGLHPGNYPLGYMPAPGYAGPHVPDPATAPAVQAAFRLRAMGWTLRAISQALTAQGVRSSRGNPLSHQALRDVLANPFYVGKVRLNDQVYPGRHMPLVSEELFLAAASSCSPSKYASRATETSS